MQYSQKHCKPIYSILECILTFTLLFGCFSYERVDQSRISPMPDLSPETGRPLEAGHIALSGFAGTITSRCANNYWTMTDTLPNANHYYQYFHDQYIGGKIQFPFRPDLSPSLAIYIAYSSIQALDDDVLLSLNPLRKQPSFIIDIGFPYYFQIFTQHIMGTMRLGFQWYNDATIRQTRRRDTGSREFNGGEPEILPGHKLNIQLEFLMNHKINDVEFYGGVIINNYLFWHYYRMTWKMANYKLGGMYHVSAASAIGLQVTFPGEDPMFFIEYRFPGQGKHTPYIALQYQHFFTFPEMGFLGEGK